MIPGGVIGEAGTELGHSGQLNPGWLNAAR
jgi:hypothetical protein